MLKKIVVSVGCLCAAAALFADTAVTLKNDSKTWKLFQWVKDGKIDHQGETLKVTTNNPGKGLHYFNDVKVNLDKGLTVTVSFDWKGEAPNGVKNSYISVGLYQYNAKNRYMNKAFSCGSIAFSKKSDDWKTFKRTVKVDPAKVRDTVYFKPFISFTKGGTVEVKNFKMEIKNVK